MEVRTNSAVDPNWDALLVDLDSDNQLGPVGTTVDRQLGGLIAQLVQRGELSGKVGDVTPVYHAVKELPGLVLVVGIGSRGQLQPGSLYRAAGSALKWLAGRQRKVIGIGFPTDLPPDLWEALIAGAMNASNGQDIYRQQKRLFSPEQLVLVGVAADLTKQGAIIGSAVDFTRRLVNEPPNVINPITLAAAAETMAKTNGLEIEIWDKARLEKENCRALLAVAAGSDVDPRLVILRHRGSSAATPELALVGKGVTFDSGGLSIKPSDGMKDMKCDMAGAASVLGAMQAAAQLRIPRHVVGLIGAVENMLGGRAYKLGDVITARSGKTIEILNTDAEGRVVLADVLDVTAELKPAKILDLATLTGACMVALGNDTTGVMSNNQPWADQVLQAGKATGESFWQLPMFDFFAEQIRSQVADIKNVGEGRWGGAITAAKFLQEFVRDIPWTHLDIAGPAYAESAKGWRDGGGTGVPVRTLIEIMRKL